MPPAILHGCIPIVVTPFTAEGQIDEAGLRREVEYLVTHGVHGLATLAIASEGYKLTEAERDRVARIVVETTARRVPVVIGADHAGTDPAVARAIAAAAAGAAALMVLPPYFVKPDAESLRRYYRRIAAAVDLPLMVQDAPQLTGVVLPATFLASLQQEAPNITYVKIEGTPAGPKTAEILRLTGGQMGVFAGWGGLSFWDGLLRGACGCMPGPNFSPDFARVYDLFVSGDHEAAWSTFNALVPFISWSMQSVDLSVWTAKESFVRWGIFASSTQRDPATLPDAVDRQQFEAFFTA
ncbi:MAG: dihydrodipicolinate synthase family protein [Chloroflexi bacterium]|nr:dihydrodipicolinate synthase family protein [Chloroflexota bacterium]